VSKLLDITRIGNPILREQCCELTETEILGDTIQVLIADMKHTLTKKEAGVGLAAPQVGEPVMLSVIGIKPTPNRPELTPFEMVIINPEIIKKHGARSLKWEACVSCGSSDDTLYAQVPRYEEVTLHWIDDTAKVHEERLNGFVAHVVQHEVDHLNGILFVDKVADTKSYMMADEYRARVVKAPNV
jgi:peptide deformylase